MTEIKPSFCRSCMAFCPIMVTIEDGRVVKVVGDSEAPLFEGYSCPKGRALPEQHNHPERLLHSVKRHADGQFRKVANDVAIVEIQQIIEQLLKQYGPRSIAMYFGTGIVGNPVGATLAQSWLTELGSPMSFNASTIDKPGNYLAPAFHGSWIAGPPTFESADTWMIVGANPVISRCGGVSSINPAKQLKDGEKRGVKLIVIDPCATQTANRAYIHLQARPGEDPTLLAGMIYIIINEKLYDKDFVNRFTKGFAELKQHVSVYTPDYVAERAGVAKEQLIRAARTFAGGKRGGVFCGTGPSFSTHSILTNYLSLCLNTLCGYWLREGEPVLKLNVLLPGYQAKAQPYPPYSPILKEGEKLRVYNLQQGAHGMPTAALADEILLDGNGQVKALFCLGGNPLMAWPDQKKAYEAMKSLDLLVVFDVEMNATAELADYVIASPLALECPGTTQPMESLKYLSPTRGLEVPWGQYTPAIVEPPHGSEVMDEREFFFRLAQQMGFNLKIGMSYGLGGHNETPGWSVPLDMSRLPSSDDIIDIQCRGSRIALEEIKQHPHGNVFPGNEEKVQSADQDCTAKLELGDPVMMQDLLQVYEKDFKGLHFSDDYPFLLTSRRINNVNNSTGRTNPKLSSKKPYNPAFMHPGDLQKLHLRNGDIITLESRHDSVKAIVESDNTVRPGVVSIAHCFGRNPNEEENPLLYGANTSKLVDMKEFDPISGIPRMSALPVSIK